MIELRLLGGIELKDASGMERRGVLAQPKRLALLVFLALRRPGSFLRRDSLIATFWPELDDAHARGALSQALRFLRRDLGDTLIERRGDEEIALAPNALTCDALECEHAFATGDFAGAVAIYRGPLLRGFFIGAAPEFERWLDGERARFARVYAQALEGEAERLTACSQLRQAADCWRLLAECEPYSAIVTQKFMHALAAMGDSVGAVAHAGEYARRLAIDLEAAPDPGVIELAERLRSAAGSESPPPTSSERPATLTSEDGVARGMADIARPHVEHTLRPDERRLAAHSRRRRWIAPAIALSVLLLVTLTVRVRPASESHRVVVSVFEVQADDVSLARLGATAAEWITQGLQQTGLVDVVPSETVLRGSMPAEGNAVRNVTPPTQLQAFARATAASLVVRGRIDLFADSLRLQAEIVDVRANRLVGVPLPVVVPRRDAMRGIALLREHVMGSLGAVLDPRLATWAAASGNPPSLEALSEFVAGMDALVRKGDAQSAVERFQRASAADSSYVVPQLWLAGTYLRTGSFTRQLTDSVLRVVERSRARLAPLDRLTLDRYAAQLRNDGAAAYRASGELVGLAPKSHFVEWLASDAYALNRPREAARLLTRLDRGQRWVQESQNPWTVLAYALHDLGDFKRELAVARQARRIAPRDVRFLWLEIQALVALGRVDAVTALLDESESLYAPREDLGNGPWNAGALMRVVALELRAHGQASMSRDVLVRAHAWYATRPDPEQSLPIAVYNRLQRLEELERWDEACVLADTLLRTDAAGPLSRAVIAQAAALRGDSATARKHLDLLVDAGWFVLAAKIASRLGDRGRALDLLYRSRRSGHRHSFYDHLTPAFEVLRSDPRYRELMRPKG